MTIEELNSELGNIDLYLLDQILKGNITHDMKILDAGCGEGRNLVYFLNNGYNVYGVDKNKSAIRMLRMFAKNRAPEHFIESTVEDMVFPPNVFDYIISSAVLHFAENHAHFDTLVSAMVNVLKPSGTLFVRMTTNLGISNLGNSDSGIYDLPDGSTRYLLDIAKLPVFLNKHGLELIDPLKSVVVHEQRSMGTLLLRKR